MLTRVLIVVAVAALAECGYARQVASTQPATRSSPPADKSVADLLHAITDWDGLFPLKESDRTPEQVAKIAALGKLERRLRRNLITGDDLDAVLAQCYRGDESATPMSKAWKAKYLWLLEQYWEGSRDVRPIEEKAYEIPFDVTLRPDFMIHDGDTDWPAMISAPLWIRCHTAWRPSMGRKVRAIADLPSASPTWAISTEELYVVIPPLGAGQHDLSVVVEIYTTEADGTDRLLQSRKIPVKLNVREQPIEFMPFKSESVTNAIKKNLRPQLFQLTYVDPPAPKGTSTYSLMLNLDDDWIAAELGVRDSLGIVIELFDNEDQLRLRAFYGRYMEESRVWDDSLIELTPTDVEKPWTVRVRPSSALSLASYREHLAAKPHDDAIDGVVRYWSGEVTVPVRIVKD